MANTILIDQKQPPNTFLAGPSSGALNAVPSQRQIVAADLAAAYGLSGNTLTAFTQTATNTFSATTAGAITGTGLTIIGTGVGSTIIPAAALAVGKQARIMIRGRMTTSVAAATIQFTLIAGGVTLAQSLAITPGNSLTDTLFTFSADVVFRQAGSVATVIGEANSIVTTTIVPLVSNAAQNVNVGVGFVNSVQLDVQALYGAATAGNSISTETVVIEIAN